MKGKFLYFSLGVSLIILAAPGMFACIAANDVAAPFEDSGKIVIENSVTEGSKAFFKGKASIMHLLSEGESACQGTFNVASSLTFTNDAIMNLEKARGFYIEAHNMGKAVGYVKARQDKLKNLNYGLLASERGIRGPAWDRVIAFMRNGDVVGFYNRMSGDIDDILVCLYAIKDKLEQGVQPETAEYWTLLQKMSEVSMFGNYATMIGRRAFEL